MQKLLREIYSKSKNITLFLNNIYLKIYMTHGNISIEDIAIDVQLPSEIYQNICN